MMATPHARRTVSRRPGIRASLRAGRRKNSNQRPGLATRLLLWHPRSNHLSFSLPVNERHKLHFLVRICTLPFNLQ
jgi:hypothetical protein